MKKLIVTALVLVIGSSLVWARTASRIFKWPQTAVIRIAGGPLPPDVQLDVKTTYIIDGNYGAAEWSTQYPGGAEIHMYYDPNRPNRVSGDGILRVAWVPAEHPWQANAVYYNVQNWKLGEQFNIGVEGEPGDLRVLSVTFSDPRPR